MRTDLGVTHVALPVTDLSASLEFYDRFASGSALGHANTMRGVQRRRPSIYELEEKLARCEVPTLIMTGDEDDPCLEPNIFMKRKMRAAGIAYGLEVRQSEAVGVLRAHLIEQDDQDALRSLLGAVMAASVRCVARRGAAGQGGK